MIKTSSDISVVAAQLIAWSALLILSDFAPVITTSYLIVTIIIGMTLHITSHPQLGSLSSPSLTRLSETDVFVQRGTLPFYPAPDILGIVYRQWAFFYPLKLYAPGNLGF